MDPPVDRRQTDLPTGRHQRLKGNRGAAARRRNAKTHLLRIAYAFFAVLIFEAVSHLDNLAIKRETESVRIYKSLQPSPTCTNSSTEMRTNASIFAFRDWDGVPALCSEWGTKRRHDGFRFADSKWLCAPRSVGNKLGLYFQARAFAFNHDVSFNIDPPCPKNDSLVSWLPQVVLPDNCHKHSEDEIRRNHVLMCLCPAPPIAHQCRDGYPQLVNKWHNEIRIALADWAVATGKPDVQDDVVTIHFRCGDMMMILEGRQNGAGMMGFAPASFYLKYLRGKSFRSIVFLTTPLDKCLGEEREVDCVYGQQCKTILTSLIDRLKDELNLNAAQVEIRDHESTMWSMHHIVFSKLSFCGGPSTFCFFASLGANEAVSIGMSAYAPSAESVIPKEMGSFHYETEIPLLRMHDIFRQNMSVEEIVKFVKSESYDATL